MDEVTSTRRLSFWAIVACLGCAAVSASFFLPWLALGASETGDLGVSESDMRALEEAARAHGEGTEEALRIVQSIRAGAPATGREWLTLLDFSLDHAEARDSLTPREIRAFRVAHASLLALPVLGGLLVLALLLDRLRAMRSWTIAALLVVGLVVGGLAGLLWLGASLDAREHAAETAAHLGLGLKLLALGGLACLLASVLGVTRRTWWRGWGLGLVASAALVLGVVFFVRG